MEDEIDLRPYVRALVQQWRVIAIITIVATIGGLIVAMARPAVYTAKSDVLILPSRTQLAFDPRFVTSNSTLGTDIASRRQALLALVLSQVIEESARTKLPPALSSEPYQRGSLAGRISVDAEGDLLHISASSPDQDNAQAVADAWAQAYVRSVNDLYGVNSSLIVQLEMQQADAEKRYSETENELEAFISGSSIVRLSDQISMTAELLQTSREGTRQLYEQYLTQARDLESALYDAEPLRYQGAAGQSQGLANSRAAT
jgi:uncharacterized protein involved in exopolysaccharide biosynthesis